ncbi:MAG: Gfo/Idh/MocA family oxidoreductase, partial [Planctomycetes bacterium]|nr:Gfo/Idh/MocA family oxidoreductase [Planctomycetota bacterium]
MDRKTDRRRFLKQSGEAAAITAAVSTLGAVHTFAEEKPDKVTLGIIGCGGIMGNHVQGLVSRRAAVSIAWLCDVDPRQMDKIAQHISGFQTPPKRSIRFEQVVKDKTVDAVIIATPHHWHAPIALRAMAEGKDVYIEKPISHVYNEGHAIIQAAKKHRRIVQQGSQMRSSPVTEKAGKLL